AVVSEIMPIILSDGADVVRERGIGLLTNAGVSPVVTDIIRALQRSDNATLKTLCEHIERLPLDQQELIFAALIANATRGILSNTTIALSTQMAELISSHRGLHRYMELLLLHGNQLSLVAFIRQLQKFNAQDIQEILQEFIGQGKESDARILVLAAHENADFNVELMELGVNLLLSRDEEPKERMGLANAMRRMQQGKQLAQLIAERAHHLEHTRDSTIFWLLAEMSRENKISEIDANTISERIRSILKRANGPHVVSILDQQLPAVLPCDTEHRSLLVEPMAELLARFLDDRSQGHIMDCLEKMGPSAIDPLWKILANHPNADVRCSCVRIFPLLCADYNDQEKITVTQRLITESQHISKNKHKGTFYLACATFILHIEDPQDLHIEIDKKSQDIALDGLPASSIIAASKHIDPTRRLEVIENLISIICADLPDGQTEEVLDPETQDVTFVLDNAISVHTDIIPHALDGLKVISSSDYCPPQLVRRITMTLMNQWRKVSRWEVMWGPSNIYHLAKILSEIASVENFPETLRLQVAESLGPRSNQLRIAEYLLCIIIASSSEKINGITHKAIRKILYDSNNGQYADDEYPDLTHVLAQFLLLPGIAALDETLPMQIARTISLHQSHVNLRCKEILLDRWDIFDNSISEQLSWLTS
ncbi:MAG: hypothetical protein HRU15_16815, partial [Planctomycetes bacterium]|nr:hypothetical protein [Planctomycetota bacterium]